MGREVHDRIATWENAGESTSIEDVSLNQFEACRQEFVPCAEIVKNNDFVTGSSQRPCGVTSNVSSAADD
jgi:hypothetical protein